jgi:hypothetical protein
VSFSPPSQSTLPPILPESTGLPRRLFRHYGNGREGINVYILSDGTVTETDPDATSVFWGAEDMTRTTEPYVVMVFWGGTGPYPVDDTMRALLEANGYTVDDEAPVDPSSPYAQLEEDGEAQLVEH